MYYVDSSRSSFVSDLIVSNCIDSRFCVTCENNMSPFVAVDTQRLFAQIMIITYSIIKTNSQKLTACIMQSIEGM
jgi:hypothetical protein